MRSFILPIIWITFLMLGSFWPTVPENLEGIKLPNIDKMVHMLFYLILAVLMFRGVFKFTKGELPKNVRTGVIICIILFGIGIEIAQEAFFPSRHFEMLDIIANIIGTFSGYLIFLKLFK